MKRGLLVYNPTAGQRDLGGRMSALIDRMRARGLELVNAPTRGCGDATEIVRAFLPKGIDLVAVCGGDGTISEAAIGLADSAVPLGVLPGGTSNVLAVELGIPFELESAEEVLITGVPRSLRFGNANGRLFLLWAGAGIDARVMARMNLFLKRWVGRAGIAVTAISQFVRYEFPRLEVTVDGAAFEATFAVVCRASHYGGRWIIAPDARPDGDDFEVVLFSHHDHWRFFRLFQELKRRAGGHVDLGLARIVRGREVLIRSLESYPVEVQVDGDTLLETPLACRIGSETVRILTPKGP